jgi:hypothetical protein
MKGMFVVIWGEELEVEEEELRKCKVVSLVECRGGGKERKELEEEEGNEEGDRIAEDEEGSMEREDGKKEKEEGEGENDGTFLLGGGVSGTNREAVGEEEEGEGLNDGDRKYDEEVEDEGYKNAGGIEGEDEWEMDGEGEGEGGRD